MSICIAIVISIFIGFLIGHYIHKKPIGILRVDHSDPDDKPYLFLEMDIEPDKLIHNKYVMFKVNTESYIPQK